MNHQDVRNQYLQVHGIDPVEIEVGAMFSNTPTTSCEARAADGEHYPEDCSWCAASPHAPPPAAGGATATAPAKIRGTND